MFGSSCISKSLAKYLHAPKKSLSLFLYVHIEKEGQECKGMNFGYATKRKTM